MAFEYHMYSSSDAYHCNMLFIFFPFSLKGNIWEQILRIPFLLEIINAVPFIITVNLFELIHITLLYLH